MKNIAHYIKHPGDFVGGVFVKLNRLFRRDDLYLKIIFRCFMGKRLDLDNPKTFSEKMQWLKLYNRRPEYTDMVDKYEAKKYVASVVGEQYIIPTLAVWDSVEDIDLSILPNQFVLKTTHAGGGGGVIICKDKATFNMDKACEKLKRSMRKNPYDTLREWPYKNVKPRIIAEQYISDAENNDLPDYKFFCFNGEPKLCQVIADRETTVTTVDWYDKNWDHQPFHEPKTYPFAASEQKRPKELERMLELAAKLSKGHPFLRVDFYDVKGSILFGELTFFPTSGVGGFDPEEWDNILGSWIKLPIENINI